jgi:hypothetical protein
MSEFSPKHENNSEQKHANPEHYEVPEKKPEAINHRHEHQEDIKNIRENVGEFSKTSEEISKHHNKKDEAPKHSFKHVQVGSQLHAQSLNQNLKKMQKHLPPYQRQFSKFIHRPVVEKVSEGVGATVARPSGLLFAGIFSFIASLVVLSICRYFGYEYNFFIGLASLVGGFFVGLLLEAISKLIKKLGFFY